jgi:glycine/D-amino acid oxidase-like deaminating enzyme
MREDTRVVVVVGGGVLGVSAAVHLLRAGVGDVTLVERDTVAQATSGAGAGFVDPWAAGSASGSGAEEIALANYGIEFYRELHELRPESPYRRRGCLWMAWTEDDWPYVERWLTEGPPDACAVEPDEIERLTSGVVRASGVFRGVLRPSSAQISAERATKALAELFVAEGGTLKERMPLERLVVRGDRVTGVETAHGALDADVVVVAAGAWTNQVLAPLGVQLPYAPLVVSRIVTEPLGIPDTLPLLFLKADASGLPKSLWIREEEGGLMYGTNYDAPVRDSLLDGDLPERYDGFDLEGVLDVQRDAAKLTNAIPALGEYRNFRVRHGAPCYTTDGRALVGAVGDVEGLYVAAGCNEQGVTHGPGFGKVLADTIATGASELADIGVWNPLRFGDEPKSAREVAAAL